MRSKIFLIAVLSFVLFIPSAPAAIDSKRLFAGVGLFSQNTGAVASGRTGARSPLGLVYPAIQAEYHISIGSEFYLVPGVLYTPMQKMSPDGGFTSSILAWSVKARKEIFGPMGLQLSLGQMIYFMNGTGGSTTLNNGNSTTSFPLPSGSTNSSLFFLGLGTGASFGVIRTDLDFQIVNLLSNKRAVNAVLSVGFGVL